MSLSLERLKVLLKEDEERRKVQEEERRVHHQETAALRKSIQDVWQAHGVLAPMKGKWIRPIPASLYQCPLSEPQTTLVPWKSLPRTVQSKLNPPSDADEESAIVEVPLAYLTAGEAGDMPSDSNSSLVQRRPLGGNLTNKLSDYTRGIAGTSRPFRPGGIDESEGNPEQEDPYRTPEAIQRAQQVLEKGSKASWKDGTIITAPPGVDFKAGLTYMDVYGKDEEDTAEEAAATTAEDSVTDTTAAPQVSMLAPEAPRTGPAPVSTAMFTRSFFDDDSLFGSSSSESDEDETDEEAEESDKLDEMESEEERKDIAYAEEAAASQEGPSGDNLPADEEEIDALLSELNFSGEGALGKKRRADGLSTNPLELAERQAQDQTNTTRKSWASTKLLPIHDFSFVVPNPAMTFPFTLDGFQQQAIARLERSESVFVAAHTSAGKTVVAEYAVALARQRATRCIYTSPIKALSNQKFRDFSQKFGSENIGLITGDLQVNADDSTCLIMTTEILRSMLYRGADLIRDIEYVVFDEVHYVNDMERGVVWEEVIIMLPSYVNLIFLSATTPNTIEFSDWIGRTKRKPVHVIKTDYRPVPLSFHLWAGTKVHKIMEGNGPFLEKGYSDAANALLPQSAKDPKKSDQKARASSRSGTGSKQLAWQAQGTKQNWMSLVRFLDRELLTPAVVFSFSKKKCVEIANMLQSLDLNTAKERSAVQAFALQTVARLSQNDAKLPQVLMICEMVQRGIGIHHGGLLPILKEMVEILFARGLVKVLFATETFAMGVNMPARAVVFNSIRKHDGTQFRVLEPGELTQMSGRAGRRGLDKVGTVMFCCFGEIPPPQPILRQMLTGSSTRLRSQFRLTYNMILNLLRVEEISVESMIKRSFSEFATQRALTANEYPQLLARGVRTLAKLDEQFQNEANTRIGVEDLEDYFSTCKELLAANSEVISYIQESEPASFEEIFHPGRMVLVSAARQHGAVRAPALVLRASSSQRLSSGAGSTRKDDSTPKTIVCMLLMPESYVLDANIYKDLKPGTAGYVGLSHNRYYAIQRIKLDQVLLVAAGKHKIDVGALLKDDKCTGHPGLQSGSFAVPNRDANNPFAGMKALGGKKTGSAEGSIASGATKTASEIDKVIGLLVEAERMELSEAGVPLLDLRSSVKRGSDVVYYRQVCEQMEMQVAQMRSFKSHRHPNLEKYYKSVERKETLRSKIETLRHLLSNESLQLFPDFLQRKAVLRKLGYVDENETVCVKGRVACEVNTCEELIVTEMVFEGILNELEPEEIVAVLSALVFQEKSNEAELDSELPEKLVTCCDQMKTIATNLGQLQKEQGLEVDPGEYCDGALKFGLVHVVYEWALGVPFKSICELTDVQEGSIVRCITRLDELCREVRNCARVVGNPTLYRKLEAASTAIKRDIVFASSLYVS